MKLSNAKALSRRIEQLRRRSPWMASLVLHCLESGNPKACEALRMMLSRMRLNAV